MTSTITLLQPQHCLWTSSPCAVAPSLVPRGPALSPAKVSRACRACARPDQQPQREDSAMPCPALLAFCNGSAMSNILLPFPRCCFYLSELSRAAFWRRCSACALFLVSSSLPPLLSVGAHLLAWERIAASAGRGTRAVLAGRHARLRFLPLCGPIKGQYPATFPPSSPSFCWTLPVSRGVSLLRATEFEHAENADKTMRPCRPLDDVSRFVKRKGSVCA